VVEEFHAGGVDLDVVGGPSDPELVTAGGPRGVDRMIAINVQGLLYTTRAALPHLLQAAEDGPRRVADIVNISSITGRVAWNGYGVYNFTKFGVNGFTESLRQEVTQRWLRCCSSQIGPDARTPVQVRVTRLSSSRGHLSPRPSRNRA
jgi:NAD(P)-dependent dehydrogenase (short-subunit alcohol dehydrogenase family)